MFDLFDGLPVHALVVHAVVVLLPLAVAGAVVVVLVPRWRRAYAPLAALVATAGTVLVPVATRSGLALAGRVGPPAGDHQQLGGQLIYFAVPFTVLLWLLVVVDRRGRQADALVGAGVTAAGRAGPAGRSVPAGSGSVPAGSGSVPARAGSHLGRRGTADRAGNGGTSRSVVTVVAVLTLLAALATGFQVFRVGESGARAVWTQIISAQQVFLEPAVL